MSGAPDKRSALARRMRTVNIALAIALVGLIGSSATRAVRQANLEAELKQVAHEATLLEDAFQRFYDHHGAFPETIGQRAFDKETLDPLRRRGYYEGHITRRLLGARADGYHTPADRGELQEYWLELTLERDPSIRLLVAHSDDAPLGGGRWLEGAFVYRNGELKPI